MFLKYNVLCILIFLIPFNLLNAQVLNPIPTGELEAGINYEDADNCGTSTFTYDKTGQTPNEVALGYINKNHPKTTCTWTIDQVVPGDAGRPNDFPGTLAQWQTVINQPPYAEDYIVTAKCIPKSGGPNNYDLEATIYPQYICPSGSRIAFDTQTKVAGCTTLPDLCEGEVVSRSLDYPFFGFLGHVGIATQYDNPSTSPGSVRQVMKGEKTLVESVTFDNFKNASTYWGDKYGVPNSETYTWNQGSSVLAEELTQDTGNGTYRNLPTFIPIQSAQTKVYNQFTGTWEILDTQSYPQFRCDTFVDWVYSVALKQQVIPFHQVRTQEGYKVYRYNFFDLFKTPHDLYNALVNTRNNGSDLSSIPSLQSSKPLE